MDEKGGWRRFQRLTLNKKSLSKRVKRVETLTTRHAHKFVIRKLDNIRDARRQIAGWLVVVGLLIAAVTMQMVWFESSYRTYASSDGGTYAEAMLGPIDTLNPLYAQSNAEQSVSKLLFSSLYDYDNTGTLRQDIASSMTIDETQKIYTVKIRPDVKWHDGINMTAEDIVYTVNLMKNPDTRAVLQSSWTNISAKVIDQQTVEFRLPSMYAAFPHALTFPILPQHVLGSIDPGSLRESTFSLSPVGSGPFSLNYYQAGTSSNSHKIVHMSAWKNYYKGAPKLSRFEVHAYQSSSDIARAVKTHEVNAALDIDDTNVRSYEGFTTKSYPISSGVYALINVESQVLKDPQLRKALQYGTDTNAVRATLSVPSPMLDYPFLPNQLSNVELPKKPAYSKAMAIKILEDNGWKLNGDVRSKDNVRLAITVVALKNSQYSAVMKNLATQWRQLGFQVTLNEFDPSATNQNFAQSVLQTRAYDVLINELAIGADPDVFAYWHSSQISTSGLNFSNYHNDIVDDALFSARLRNEPSLRQQKYRSFTQLWLDDVPAIGLFQSVAEYTHSNRTNSLPNNEILPSIVDRYNNVIYWTAERQQVYKTP